LVDVNAPRRQPKPRPEAPPGLEKRTLQPGALLCPLPVVLVTCCGRDRTPNVFTVAWTGIVCSDPPMLSISVRPERHSFRMLQDVGEFVVNVPSARDVWWTDACGVHSGRDRDKIGMAGFTLLESEKVSVPALAQCPVHLECRVQKTLPLGTHVLFLARIVNVRVNEALVDRKGKVALEKAGLIAYAHGFYYRLGKRIGRFGFSVRKKRAGGSSRRGTEEV